MFISLCSLLLIFFIYHDTGHGKIETMGALTISGLLLATGGGIAWSAVDTLQAWHDTLVFLTSKYHGNHIDCVRLS